MARQGSRSLLVFTVVVIAYLSAVPVAHAWYKELYGQWELVSWARFEKDCTGALKQVRNTTRALYSFSADGHVFYVNEAWHTAFAGTYSLSSRVVTIKVSAGIGYEPQSRFTFEAVIGGKKGNILTTYQKSDNGLQVVGVYEKVEDAAPQVLAVDVPGEWSAVSRTFPPATTVVPTTTTTRAYLCLSKTMYSFAIVNNVPSKASYGVAGWASTNGNTLTLKAVLSTDPKLTALAWDYTLTSGQLTLAAADETTTYQRWKK